MALHRQRETHAAVHACALRHYIPMNLKFASRNAEPDAFRKGVEDALLCTHVHPDGIAGALAQASAVAALSLSTPASEP